MAQGIDLDHVANLSDRGSLKEPSLRHSTSLDAQRLLLVREKKHPDSSGEASSNTRTEGKGAAETAAKRQAAGTPQESADAAQELVAGLQPLHGRNTHTAWKPPAESNRVADHVSK